MSIRVQYIAWRLIYHSGGHCACRSTSACANWLFYWERRLIAAKKVKA